MLVNSLVAFFLVDFFYQDMSTWPMVKEQS